MNIKVQIPHSITSASIIASGSDKAHLPLTFIAYSDAMKARIMEKFITGNQQIAISEHTGPKQDGEWHEAFAAGAIFNK